MSGVQDRPKTNSADFSAIRESHDILVKGRAVGDYRVKSVSLVRAHHQPGSDTLELLVEAKLGPVENPHPEILKNFDLEFKVRPAGQFTTVKIVNGHQHFTLPVKP
jgi:hypothetical protein